MNGFSLIAAMENDKCAFNSEIEHDNFNNDVWIKGASCHMWSSLKGMYNTVAGLGGIKVRSGKILMPKLVNSQKDGSIKVIVLNKVHFVPYMYCDLFSITAEMDKGFSVTGKKILFLRCVRKI